MEWNMEWKIFSMEMEWKKIASMEYGKIVFHSILYHALTTGINATCFTNKRQFQKTDDRVTAEDRNVSLDIFSRAKITTILLGKRSTPARF